jgi:hypothetical protein
VALVQQAIGEALRQRSAILDLNKAQRNGTHGIGNPHAFGRKGSTQTWGRPFLRIPESDLIALELRNPALRSRDPQEFTAAWLEFERSDESLPYRVTEDYIGSRNPVRIGSR